MAEACRCAPAGDAVVLQLQWPPEVKHLPVRFC